MMAQVWLHVVGIGEDGLKGLSPIAAAAVERAQIIIGGARHLAMVDPGGDQISDDGIQTDRPKVAGGKITLEETTLEEITSEETTDQKTASERITAQRITGGKITGEETTAEKTTLEEITSEETPYQKVTGPKVTGQKIPWPSPFDQSIDLIKTYRQTHNVVVLATGDPLWCSVGTLIGQHFTKDEVMYYPHVSAFQLAACRMGWSVDSVQTLTIHGRPLTQIAPFVAPDQRLLVLTSGAAAPGQVASWLTQNGYGPSPMCVLSHMGGDDERRFDGTAQTWTHDDIPAFHTLAVQCTADPGARVLPKTGLPDDVFQHDGKMTKSEVRAITLARLVPHPGAVLWDVGAGCGSIAIEWLRAAHGARCCAIEPNGDRCALIADNAYALGAAQLNIIQGHAPDALSDLPAPDAVFLGGGLSQDVFNVCYQALKPHGRLTANCVTLESEAILLKLYARYGGHLTKIAIHRADPVGPLTGWRPFMPVTQWSIVK